MRRLEIKFISAFMHSVPNKIRLVDGAEDLAKSMRKFSQLGIIVSGRKVMVPLTLIESLHKLCYRPH
jgi:hypothetical protein